MQRLSFGDNKNIQRPFDLLQLRLTYSAGNYCNKFHCQPFTAKMKTVGFPITNMQTTPFHPMTWITNIFAIREVVQKMETFMAFSIHGWGKGGGGLGFSPAIYLRFFSSIFWTFLHCLTVLQKNIFSVTPNNLMTDPDIIGWSPFKSLLKKILLISRAAIQ